MTLQSDNTLYSVHDYHSAMSYITPHFCLVAILCVLAEADPKGAPNITAHTIAM